MTAKQYLLQRDFRVAPDKMQDLTKSLLDLTDQAEEYDGMDPDIVLTHIASEYGYSFEWSDTEEWSIDGIDPLDNQAHPHQMRFLSAIAPHVVPESYIVAMDEEFDAWQWYFDLERVFTRLVGTVGLITPEEDAIRSKNGLTPKTGFRVCSYEACMEVVFGKPGVLCEACREKPLAREGYSHCRCRDCFELVITGGGESEFCEFCKKNGCPGYQGVEGVSQECRQPDAYGPIECPHCRESDYMWYNDDEGTWNCDACETTHGKDPGEQD